MPSGLLQAGVRDYWVATCLHQGIATLLLVEGLTHTHIAREFRVGLLVATAEKSGYRGQCAEQHERTSVLMTYRPNVVRDGLNICGRKG
jgi:hypothetical protein